MPKKEGRTITTMRLPDDLLASASAQAKVLGISRTDLVERLLRAGLKPARRPAAAKASGSDLFA